MSDRHHLDNVRPLHSASPNPNHPSMRRVFDQDADAADRCVLLTQIEAQLVASLLNLARPHLPSPRAVDEAIDLLMGRG